MRLKVPVICIALLLGMLVGVSAPATSSVLGQDPDSAGANALGAGGVGQFANCRTGAGLVHNSITTYSIAPLNLGWYVDWYVHTPILPPNMEYYLTVRVKQDTDSGVYLPTYTVSPPLSMASNGLGPVVQANPGSIWIVGNEPDVATQDGTVPEKYAEIYHQVYHFVKSIDPTAQIAIAAVAQPTPLRLQYLDRVLVAYRNLYGTKMPVDIWNTHLYIAREVRGDWGVRIPIGIDDVDYGAMYTLAQGVDVEVFKSLIRSLRSWMKTRGYQDRPLIITEWGGLMPLWFLDDEGVTEQDFHTFMRDAIAFMATANDASLGYAADGYRLVQREAFWSLDADDVFPDDPEFPMYGPPLFRSSPPFDLTSTGQYYRDVVSQAHPASVDLALYRSWASRSSLAMAPGDTITLTVGALVSNSGNSTFAQNTQVEFVNVTDGANLVLGRADLSPFTGCGTTREVRVVWAGVSPGRYSIQVRVDPDNVVPDEASESNNVMTFTVLVGNHGIFLPLVQKSS